MQNPPQTVLKPKTIKTEWT